VRVPSGTRSMFVLPFGQWLCAARRIIAWLSRHCSSLTEHAVKFLPVTAVSTQLSVFCVCPPAASYKFLPVICCKSLMFNTCFISFYLCPSNKKLMMPWLPEDVDKQMNITSCVQQCKFKCACKVICLLIHK
jgi:hypothetical protein